MNAALDAPLPQDEPGNPVRVAAQWAIYPLGRQEHMPLIYDAIAATKQAGVFTRGQHFVSRLDGELGDVLGAIRTAFQATCERGGHVVAHVTLSANSPSAKNAGTPRSEPK